jgi:hypothetical protein
MQTDLPLEDKPLPELYDRELESLQVYRKYQLQRVEEELEYRAQEARERYAVVEAGGGGGAYSSAFDPYFTTDDAFGCYPLDNIF